MKKRTGIKSLRQVIADQKEIISRLEADKEVLQSQNKALKQANVGAMDLMRDSGELQAVLRRFIGMPS